MTETGLPAVDLRSDTVTTPTDAMRRAMAAAEVGDDVFGEDPTARRLEARVAELLGKEAALFVPSGVMANQIGLRLHTRPGDEVVLAERSHIFHYEGGAPAALWGVQLRPVGDASGLLTPADLHDVVRGAYDWEPRTRLLCLENTVNKSGGAVQTAAQTAAVAGEARALGLAVHLDGARLWNAAAALGADPADLAAPADTVAVCLSKGLGAPVGSLLAGPADLLREARRVRKLLGGGMRQVGVLAAAGLVALDDRHRLADDHARACALAGTLSALPGAVRLVRSPETNIVLFDTLTMSAADALAALDAENVRMVAFGPTTIRATFHRDVDDRGLGRAQAALGRVFG
jgi:threonine aldolase